MFGFDKMFDFNRNGKLDSWERAAQFQFMDEMMKDDEKSIFDDDDEIDIFADAGLDYDELEFMDPDERREVLEDAGLDPDEYTGFYVNIGLDRLVMMRYGVDDVRLFHSGDLRFLRQFR